VRDTFALLPTPKDLKEVSYKIKPSANLAIEFPTGNSFFPHKKHKLNFRNDSDGNSFRGVSGADSLLSMEKRRAVYLC